MDEIGRGTSTFDGLSLAWSIAKYLLEVNRSYTLFATHYLELSQIPSSYPQCSNVHLSAIEQGKELIFLHQVKPGHASQSYGIQVAQLAGVPKPIIAQARKKLSQLEAQNNPKSLQNDLFSTHEDASLFEIENSFDEPNPIELAVRELDPDSLSPKEALETLYNLKKLLG